MKSDALFFLLWFFGMFLRAAHLIGAGLSILAITMTMFNNSVPFINIICIVTFMVTCAAASYLWLTYTWASLIADDAEKE